MIALQLHGVRIAVEVPARYEADARLALAALEVPRESCAAELAFAMSPEPRPAVAGWTPVLETDDITMLVRDGAVLLYKDASYVQVTADARRIVVSEPPDAAFAVPYLAAMFQTGIMIALRAHGLYYLHAGALALGSGRRLLIAGVSGSGKTTTTLALARAGSTLLGDDTMFFAEREGRAVVLAFPRALRVAPRTQAAFPSFAFGAMNDKGKRELPLAAVPAARGDRMEAPHLVIFPAVTSDDASSIHSISPADGLVRLHDSSAAHAFGEARRDLARELALLGRLIADATMWELRLGRDALATPERIAALVEGLP